jgi:hypothetical protein
LDGGGVLLFSENSLGRIGMTANATQSYFLNQPARVFVFEVDLEMNIDIQAVKGVREGVHRRPRV